MPEILYFRVAYNLLELFILGKKLVSSSRAFSLHLSNLCLWILDKTSLCRCFQNFRSDVIIVAYCQKQDCHFLK